MCFFKKKGLALIAKPPVDAFVYGGYAVFDPWRGGLAFKEMVEELQFAPLDVFSVLAVHEVMCLTIIVKEPYRLLQSAECCKHFDALVPRNGSVGVVMHDDPRRRRIRQVEQRGVFDIQFGILPKRSSNPALRPFVLELPAHSALPADAAICGGHVYHGRTRPCGSVHIGTCDQVCHLVPTPALSLDAQLIAVNPGLFF